MVKHILRDAENNLRTFLDQRRRDLGNKNQAQQILSVMAKHGQTLSGSDKAKCRDYAATILGDAKYEHWLQVYCAVSGEFKPGWIPDDYYFDHVVQRWNGEPGKTSYSKSVSGAVLNTPLLPDLLVLINGLFVTPSGQTIPEDRVKQSLFEASDRVVFKADSSIQGRGVFIYEPGDFDIAALKAIGNGVFQSFIQQHQDLDRFAPGVASTLRLTTVKKDDGATELRGAVIRFGRMASKFVKSQEQISLAVNTETGEMQRMAYDPNFTQLQKHPDTGVAFDGGIYPGFDIAKQAILDLHDRLRFSRCVGWDVVIDENKDVKIIEWNGFFNSLRGHEALQGPIMTGLGLEDLWKEPPPPGSRHTVY